METERFRRTRAVILTRVLLVPFVVLMMVVGTLVYYFVTALRGQVAAELSRIAEDHRGQIDQFLRERAADLEYTAELNTRADLARQETLQDVFRHLQERSQAFLDIGVFDDTGNHVAYVGPFDLKGKNYAHTDWFKAVQHQSVYTSDVFLGYRKIPHFVLAIRREEEGRPWYLRATIDTLFFNELVENVQVGKTGEVYLVNSQGQFQTRRRSGGALMDADPDRGLYRSEEGRIVTFTAFNGRHVRHLYATGRLRQNGWLLVVRQETWDAYRPLTRAIMVALAIIVLGGAVVVFMGFMLATGVANQLTVAAMEKRRMGSQLIMAGKLAEVGEMSAGVAHEINNPLQVMRAEQALILEILKDVERQGMSVSSGDLATVRDSVDQIGTQIDRCGRITQGLLKFARKTEAAVQPLDLSVFIPDVVRMVETRAHLENIRVRQVYEPGLPAIPSDPAMLQQVILNLANNALHALKGRRDAEVRISAVKEQEEIVLTVADNGCGIPADNLEKVFMPFFTTKPVGQGTGLGLSTCYGIVERLGGRIGVTSEVNVGTVFTVRLPLSGPPSV